MTNRGSQAASGVSRGEQLAAALAAGASLLLTVRIWSLVAATQNTWLFPALYFIELAALAVACAVTYAMSSPLRPVTTWATVGVLAAFSVLGAWTVGLYFMPVTALFLALAVLADLRQGRSLLPHAGVGLAAAVGQSALMLLLARLS